MNKNSLLVCIALLLVVGSAFLLRRGSEDEPRIAEATAAAPEEEAAEPGALLQPPATANNAASERVPLGPEPAPIDDAYRAALSGVSGRLVELDGRPAVGQDVALLEVFVDEWWAFLGLPERKLPPELVVARDRTGSDGRFLLKGARPSALHALSGSARSPRVPLRMIAEPLEPGRLVELGDVVLPARAALAGRIVDERGAPVAGARIRAGLVGKSAEMIF